MDNNFTPFLCGAASFLPGPLFAVHCVGTSLDNDRHSFPSFFLPSIMNFQFSED
jgi:hypothetical protein